MVRRTMYVLGLVGLCGLFLLLFLEAFIAGAMPIPDARGIRTEASSRTIDRLYAKLRRSTIGAKRAEA